ncbi:hypothetical protein OSB04_005951 [Centaurea solstitialis]|uniref:Uncharacterized protein n=1 Tax=Centaurea solstitialis TaxID=347529 RepID=A0AA38TUU6_9ASTR|nr:hypothetical protein OSB04_005951 [Centaurea solstitialis]
MRSVTGGRTAQSVMKQVVRSDVPRNCKDPDERMKLVFSFHSKFVRDDLSWWEPDKLLNNSYKCCKLKVAQIFDRVANIGRDPRLRLLLGFCHK